VIVKHCGSTNIWLLTTCYTMLPVCFLAEITECGATCCFCVDIKEDIVKTVPTGHAMWFYFILTAELISR